MTTVRPAPEPASAIRPSAPDDGDRLALDQLTYVNTSFRRSSVAFPLFTIAIAAILLLSHPWVDVAVWAGVSIGAAFLAQAINAAFFLKPRIPGDVTRWAVMSCIARVMPVLSWCAAAVMFWVPGDPLNHLILLMVLVGGGSVTVSVPAHYWPTFLVSFLPFSVTSIGLALFEGGPIYLGFAALTALYGCYLVVLARIANQRGREALALRYAQERLICELERANHAKAAFLASMSHELRTPLNAIMGFSDMILSEVLGPVGHPTYRAYAKDIHESGTHLLGLITDILDMSRLEAGKVQLHCEHLEADRFVDSCLRTVRPLADTRRLALSADVTRDLVLYGDARALKQILLNLLSNAIKFTPEGGRVSTFVHPLPDGEVLIGVSDTGIGIHAEDLPRLFEPFSQASRGPMVTAPGTGLGLSIVKGFAEAHGGRVAIDTAPGAGTTVSIVLPAGPPAPAMREAAA